jgi:hypothetical protein
MAWRSAILTIDNKRAHSMLDDRFEANSPVDQLPHLAWFGVFCSIAPGGGFWDPEEGPQLESIEKDLLRLCDRHGNGWAAYVHCLNTPGLREYYVYFGPGGAMEKVLPDLKAAHPAYRLEYDRIDDLKWAQYRKWLGWVANGQRPPTGAAGSLGLGLGSRIRQWFGRKSGR